jgi:hypothetical protein
MEDDNVKKFIKDRLDYYDKTNLEYKDLIKIKNVSFDDTDELKIKFNDEYTKVSTIGIFDINTNVWLWAWAIPMYSPSDIEIARKILDYGLSLDPKSNSYIHDYIKQHFVDSRIYFENEHFLDIHLSLCLYISKNGKFIYPRYVEKKNMPNIIIYYLVY